MSVEDIQKLTEAGKNPVGQYVAAVLDEGDGQGRHQQYVEVSETWGQAEGKSLHMARDSY